MKTNLYDTYIISQLSKDSIKSLINYLINNRHSCIIDKDKFLYMVNNIPSMSRNPISDMFFRLKDFDYSYFLFISTLLQSNIPECLLYSYFNIDIKELKSFFPEYYNVLSSISEFKDKIIINLTNYLNKEQTKILDVTGLQKNICRSLCSRSYFNFESTWISGSFLYSFIKLYSIPIASNISRLYNLATNEMYLLAIIFGYYYLQKCVISSHEDYKKILSGFDYLGYSSNILSTVSLIDETLEEKFKDTKLNTISKLIYVINELAPKRLTSLDERKFLTISRTYNYNSLVSLISIEYPGYWLYNIFSVTSGERNNLFFVYKNTNLLKESIAFVNNLLYSSDFWDSFS